tara:strand:- start:6316 stop:6978 length:663 start_codon:yes stop_codon:yes gene_type:complete
MKIVKFNKQKYPFHQIVQSLYDYKLESLDDSLDHSNGMLGMDTDSVWHNIFYDKLRSGWPELINIYEAFIQDIIGPYFKDETKLIYQATPGYRVNQPGGKAIYLAHCDGDELHKHPNGEINIFMPLTKAFGNNSIWIESIPGLGDYKAVEMEFGECLMFYGNRLRHSNNFNDTGKTRCSFDFRIIPPVNYDPSYRLGSATKGHKFLVGSYYKEIEIKEAK